MKVLIYRKNAATYHVLSEAGYEKLKKLISSCCKPHYTLSTLHFLGSDEGILTPKECADLAAELQITLKKRSDFIRSMSEIGLSPAKGEEAFRKWEAEEKKKDAVVVGLTMLRGKKRHKYTFTFEHFKALLVNCAYEDHELVWEARI